MSKSVYCATANPKVAKYQTLNSNWFSSAGINKFTLKLMTLLLVMSLPKLKLWKNDGFYMDDSNCQWRLALWLQTKNCLNLSHKRFWWRQLSKVLTLNLKKSVWLNETLQHFGNVIIIIILRSQSIFKTLTEVLPHSSICNDSKK